MHGGISAIGKQQYHHRLTEGKAAVFLGVCNQIAEQSQCEDDQRQRDRVEHEIAESLRSDDIDIGVDKREKERPLESD